MNQQSTSGVVRTKVSFSYCFSRGSWFEELDPLWLGIYDGCFILCSRSLSDDAKFSRGMYIYSKLLFSPHWQMKPARSDSSRQMLALDISSEGLNSWSDQ